MLRPAERRWTKAERDARIAAAPPFSFEPPTDEHLDTLVAGYVRLTGDQVRSQPKRNLIAACYRAHGDDALEVIAERYLVTATVTNLLGDVRCLPRRSLGEAAGSAVAPPTPSPALPVAAPTQVIVVTRVSPPMARRPIDCGCPVERLRPGLIHCADHTPPFDGTDDRRHDRRPSNPEAARFFRAAGTFERATPVDALDETVVSDDRRTLGTEPVRLPGKATSAPSARTANTVVMALVVALLDLEHRRDRGNVRRPMTPRRLT